MMRGDHARCGTNHFRSCISAVDIPTAQREKPDVKNLLKAGLVIFWAMTATSALLGLVLCGVLGMEVNAIMQKVNSQTALYIFPAFIFFEFYFFINDLLAYFYKNNLFGFVFSEVRFTYDLDNNNTPIPSRAKLLQLYPLSISLTLLGFVLVLITR
jgi:hypothetical protein